MQILDVLSSPWAILPEKLAEIQAFYAAHLRGEKIDISALEDRLGRKLSNTNQGYTINSGVAVIPIHGVIGKKMNMLSEISGGASTELIDRDIKAALNDPNVESIMLHIDSPGGTVDGTQNLTETVRNANQIKPVVSFIDGMMASAAYWIGSAAGEIVASSETSQIGSIGVRVEHIDASAADAAEGVKRTVIVAGKYKNIAGSESALTEDGKNYLQDQVDGIYEIMVNDISLNLNTNFDAVLENMADGRVFLAKEAQSRGMISRIANFDETIASMASKNIQSKQRDRKMDLETFKAEYPELVTALHAEGAALEVARIKSCDDALLAGHEELVNSMKFDGKSTGGDVAMAIVMAEKRIRSEKLSDFGKFAPAVVPMVSLNSAELGGSEPEKTGEERLKSDWETNPKIKAEFATYENYASYMMAVANGKVRVLNGNNL